MNHLSAEALEALGRELPGSHLLRERCLQTLTKPKHPSVYSPYDDLLQSIVAGKIIGSQFPDESIFEFEFENNSQVDTTVALIALCISKPSHKLLQGFLEEFRERAGVYQWPEAAYLVSTLGDKDEFTYFIRQLLHRCDGGIWDFLPICLEPVIQRIMDCPRNRKHFQPMI